MLVTVMIIPGESRTVEAENGATVGEVIKQAGWDSSGYQVAVSSNPSASLASTVSEGDKVVLTRQVKGA